MVRKQAIDINNIVFSQIESRYHILKSSHTGSPNTIYDSQYPYFLYQAIKKDSHTDANTKRIFSTGYSISELISRDMGTRQMHISDLIKILGYSQSEISKILKIVKSRGQYLILLGAGGTGSNFLYWTYKLSELCHISKIFSTISVIDYDEFDIVNMLRIPFIPEINSHKSTLKVDCIPTNIKSIAAIFNTINKKIKTIEDIDLYRKTSNGAIRNHVYFYGAPDIQTRKLLNQNSVKFFAATHQNDKFSITHNPTVDDDLILETYGKIDLNKFFINQLYMTIKFLEFLGTVNNFDIFGPDEKIINNNFSNIIQYGKHDYQLKAGSKRFEINFRDVGNIELENTELTENDIQTINTHGEHQ